MTDDAAVNPFGDPDGPPPTNGIDLSEPSIVDTILNLDELLSADVRRAEKTYRFSVKPWLEAEIEELDYKLDALIDNTGRPLGEDSEASVGGGGSQALALAEQIRDKQQEYSASLRTGRVAQMSDDDWTEFRSKHRKGFEGAADSAERREMFTELIVASASTPPMSLDQVHRLRSKLGAPVVDVIATAAWEVNTQSGVNIPKSQLSSVVRRRQAQGRS